MKYTDPTGRTTCSYEGEFDDCDDESWKNYNNQDDPIPPPVGNATGDALAHANGSPSDPAGSVYPLSTTDYEMRPWWEFVELASFVVPTGFVSRGVVKIGGKLFTKLVNPKTGQQTLTPLQKNKAAGDAFEELTGVAGHKSGIKMGNTMRFPDRYDRQYKILQEAKFVKRLSLTPQLRDYINFTRDTGGKMILHIRKDTHITKPLQDALDSISARVIRH